MEAKIQVLILEHDLNDLGLLQYELRKSGLDYASEIVQTKGDYENALRSIKPDIILSDYSLPAFDGLAAFHIRQTISPKTPFIIVSGTVGEENAVELIKMGVTDCVLKDKLYQIVPKIQRALNEAEDRKQKEAAELQLRQREEHLQKIMDLSLDVIYSLDQDGRFVSLSAASELVLDYLPEELIGVKVIDLVHEADKKRTSQAIADLGNGTDIINFEKCFIRKSGTPITLLWSARWNPDDKLSYCVAKDISDIRKAEAKIKHNEKRFRTLLQNSSDGLTLLAADGTVIERSASALKILGLNPSEVTERLNPDFVHPDDFRVFKAALQQVMHNAQEIVTVEGRFFMPGGGQKWIETTLHNQLHEPAVGAIVLNFRDITERKLTEIALEKSEEKYRNLFHSSPIPMWVYDVESYRFLDVNSAAIRHYGYSREEFLTMTLKDIRFEEDIKDLKKVVQKASDHGGFSQATVRHIKKNGEVIYVEVQGNSIELRDNNARVALATDISERMTYIQTMEEQNLKLREIAWMQSHVVRAPLARMMGLISLLNSGKAENSSTVDIIKYILTSAHELDDIVREIVRKTDQIKGKPILEANVD